jgi:hypothetical protein
MRRKRRQGKKVIPPPSEHLHEAEESLTRRWTATRKRIE